METEQGEADTERGVERRQGELETLIRGLIVDPLLRKEVVSNPER